MFIFAANDLPTDRVVVYSDRAEVCKKIKLQLQAGNSEVQVENLSKYVINDSIRVEGQGSDKACILEVKFHDKVVKKDESLHEKEKQLNEECKRLKEQKREVEQQIERLTKQRTVLDGLAKQLGTTNNSPNDGESDVENSAKNNGSYHFLSSGLKALEKLDSFLEYYESKTASIDADAVKLERKLEKLNEEIEVVLKNLGNTCCRWNNTVKIVTVMVNAEEACSVVLDLIYVVQRVRWTPSYSVRVQIVEETIKLSYFGSIRQNTGEDWNNVKLTLSTAQPQIGGEIPQLKTTKISFYKPAQQIMLKKKRVGRSGMRGAMAFAKSISAEVEEEALDMDASMEMPVALAKENVTSSSFEIVNRTSIPSDNADHKHIIRQVRTDAIIRQVKTVAKLGHKIDANMELIHKVTIAIIDLKPKFEYRTVPCKSTYAYLVAKMINESVYTLLAGQAAVFVASNFVANTALKPVNVGERFEISLGVDPSIKVEYTAPRKFNEEYGLLSRSNVVTNEQRIHLHNTKTKMVAVSIVEPLPMSTDEKLKVTLLEPTNNTKIEKGCKASLNKQNNVEWVLTMQPNEKRTLIMKYQVDYPKTESLEYKEEM
uniref:DUF4139 domain-containing protein n=1 Tax=Romanomermis culicivorax TaxID=13658 RepID=A0A915KZE7_ROMCU